MASVKSSPERGNLPSLPPELWVDIIGCFCRTPKNDLAFLWTECRNISKLFRNEVERFFVSKYLPKTRLQFNIGMSSSAPSTALTLLMATAMRFTMLTDDAEIGVHAPFDFDRVSPDGRIAFFRFPASDKMNRGVILDRIDELSPDVINEARTFVQIRYTVRDIYIPDLKVDKTSEEISFDWLNLFSIFFAEEKRYDSIMQEWLDEVKSPGAPIMQALTGCEGDNFGDIFTKQLDIFTTQEKAARKEARRSRVRRQSQDLDCEDIIFDEDYSEKEKSCLQEVQMAAFVAGFESFSDDEEDEPPEKEAEQREWSFQWEQEPSPIDD